MRSVVLAAAAAALVLTSCSGSHRHVARKPVTTTRTVAAPRPAPRPRRVRGPHDEPIPILMYHVIAAAPPGAPNPGLFVSRRDFSVQMSWLARHGFHAITLRRAYDYWRGGVPLPQRPVVLSFDDGYLNDLTDALPVLRRFGWPGVLNLEVNNVRPGDLTAAQVRVLIRAGWEVDAHTLTHPDLTTLGSAALRREVAGSRDWIRRRFGVPVSFFCYPAGKYDADVVAAVRAAGYLAATTVHYGFASPRQGLWTLDRVRIDGSDGLAGFAAKLSRRASPASDTGAGD
jgi:peptidoglycan/xylan/chitin deacetylase (PgdA/CDA1 family)